MIASLIAAVLTAAGPAPPELADPPYLGIACPIPNSTACDRVGLYVPLERPHRRVIARIGDDVFALDDPSWSNRRAAAGFLQPAHLNGGGPLAVHDADGAARYLGGEAPTVLVRLDVDGRPTAVFAQLHAGWG